MNTQYSFVLGGLLVIIKPENATTLVLADPIYELFAAEEYDPGTVSERIVIDVRFGTVPDFSGGKLLFDAGSWTLFRDDGNSYLLFRSAHASTPFMNVRFGPDISVIHVICSGDFVRAGNKAENPFRYPLDQILLMHYLSSKEGVLLHSAGFCIEEKAYLFPGASGAGKSTLTRNFLHKKGFTGLSDDRIIVRKSQDDFVSYGTPWAGDARIAANKSAPLRGLFFLAKSKENKIEPIRGEESFRRLMPVSSILWYDDAAVQRVFTLFEELIARVPSHIFHFTPDARAADCLEEFIKGA